MRTERWRKKAEGAKVRTSESCEFNVPGQSGLWGWGRPRAAQDMIWAVPRGLDPAHACCYRQREADWRKLKPSYIFSHMSTHFLRN